MASAESLLSKDDELEIIEAIRLAENQTSGEIRVHLEEKTLLNAFDRAREVFHLLKMDNTKLQNGVLIYLAAKDQQFVILGDKGINDVVGSDFWHSTKDLMSAHFKNGDFKQGLIEGIARAGQQLQHYFPWDQNDSDELSNEISRS